jgi:nuclear GTP-binding protein
MLELVLTLT